MRWTAVGHASGACGRRGKKMRLAVLGSLVAAIVAAAAAAQAVPGQLDESFGSRGIVLTDFGSSSDDVATAAALQRDGKVVAAGWTLTRGDFDFALARYERDGSLDESFGDAGRVITDIVEGSLDLALAVTIQADGKIVAAGLSDTVGNSDFTLVRYRRDGSLDTSFGQGGIVRTDFGGRADQARALAPAPAGGLVAAGTSFGGDDVDSALARYDSDGSLDTSFAGGGTVLTDSGGDVFDQINAIEVEPSGSIVTGGLTFGPSFYYTLGRYDRQGHLDQSFGDGGIVVTDVGPAFNSLNAVALDPRGGIIAAGQSYADQTYFDFVLTRYGADGMLDAAFGTGGTVRTDFGALGFDAARAIGRAHDNMIVAAGSSDARGSSDFALARYDERGKLDETFGSGGMVATDLGSSSADESNALVLQPDGRIVAVGSSDAAGGLDFALVRYAS